ncbi:ATP-binding domain-containing protein [Actinomadura luteofluorescens]
MEAALGGERPSSRSRRRGRKAPPPRARHEYELTTNYRNSTEIAAVSARVLARALPDAKPARAVRASGIEPVVRVVPESGLGSAARAAVEELLGQVEGTIGLIVPLSLEESGGQASLFDGPATAWDAADRDRLGAGLPERVQVLDVLEAKGLEFDAAVIVAPETVAAQSPRGLRVLYVAVSRATQRLTVLTADPQWRDALITG